MTLNRLLAGAIEAGGTSAKASVFSAVNCMERDRPPMNSTVTISGTSAWWG